MAESDEGDVVILTDADGEYYIVAAEVIERGKLDPDLKDLVAEAAESEVAGFSFSFGSTQFRPNQVSDTPGSVPPGSPYGVVGHFTFVQPPGVDISRILLPGR